MEKIIQTRAKREILWEPIISAAAVVATILGVVVPLFIHMDNKTEVSLKAIQEEMKDFHGRLCTIEERGRK